MKEHILKRFGTKEFEFKNDVFYTDEYCITTYNYTEGFGIMFHPTRDNGKTYQLHKGTKIYKRPKKSEIVLCDTIYNTMIQNVSPFFKCLVSDDYTNYEEYIQKP
jgi:hypothetical protein